jgi:hypothetical protein
MSERSRLEWFREVSFLKICRKIYNLLWHYFLLKRILHKERCFRLRLSGLSAFTKEEFPRFLHSLCRDYAKEPLVNIVAYFCDQFLNSVREITSKEKKVRKVTTERRGNQKPKSKREKYKIRLVV